MTQNQVKDISEQNDMYNVRLARYDKLQQDRAVSTDDYDKLVIQQRQILDNLNQLQGQADTLDRQIISQAKAIEQAQAELRLADYYVGQCELRSPGDGAVTNLYVRPGQYVKVGEHLFGVVDDKPLWVEANYKECSAGMLKPGQTAWITTDLYPFKVLRGKVKSVIHAVNRDSNPQGALPYIKPTVDWIRLQYRFRVILELDEIPEGMTLRMGADARTMILLD